MENPISNLGNTLLDAMRGIQSAGAQRVFDLGTIKQDGSLSVDGLGTIPKGEYMISLHLGGKTGDGLITHSATHTHDKGEHTHTGGEHAQYSGSGSHSHNGGGHFHDNGSHVHVLPEPLRGIKSGDRVLVAWVGVQAIVIDIIINT